MDLNNGPDNNNQDLNSASKPAFNMPENNQPNNQGGAKQGESSSKKAADLAAKGAATYFGGAAGAKTYDNIKNAPVVGGLMDKGLDKLGKDIEKSPLGGKAAKMLDESGALDAASKGLDAYTGSSSKKSGGDAKAETPSGETSEGELEGSDPFKVNKGVIGIVAGFFIGIIVLIIVLYPVFLLLSPFFMASTVLNSVGGALNSFGEHVASLATGCGWVPASQCTEEIKFYDELADVELEYRMEYGVKLNTNLLVATLTNNLDVYNFDTGEEYDEDTIYEEMNPEEGEEAAEIMYANARKNLYILADQMAPAYDPERVEDIETGIFSWTYERELDLDNYKKYLEEVFIANYYYPKYNGADLEQKVDSMINLIYLRVDLYENYANEFGYNDGYSFTGEVYASCAGVTLTDNDYNVLEVIPLEEYVARVVQKEIGGYTTNVETLKAQAIAVRTYTLVRSDNCTKPMRNSTRDQVAADVVSNSNINIAVEETMGQVLIYENEVFLTEYDSYCYDDSDCSYRREGDTLYVTYTKLPLNETHEVALPISLEKWVAGGHGRGMSQLAALNMGENLGYTYDQILSSFYSENTSLSLMSSFKSGTYTSTTAPAVDKDELLYRSDMYEYQDTLEIAGRQLDVAFIYSKYAKNLGQCVWYARSRALEIILNSSMPDDVKAAAFDVILNTTGNGESWYRNNSLEVFERTDNYELPRPGAIVSWSSNSSIVGHSYGHVAIIESVDYENRTVVMSEGWNGSGADGEDSWGNVRVKTSTKTFEQVRDYNNGYIFNGYVYILG